MLTSNPNWHKMSVNKRGSIAEIIGCYWLMMEGYDVYKNVSAWGAADIIAVKGNEIILVDVSFASGCNDSKKSCAEQRKAEGRDIKYLYVFPNGTCNWRDKAFPVIIRACPCCRREYQVKERSTRNKCEICSRLGRKPEKTVYSNQKQKKKAERDKRLERRI